MHMEPLSANGRFVESGRHLGGSHRLPQAGHRFGGGKSEISKAISDAILDGYVYVPDLERDMDAVSLILARDFSDRFLEPKGTASITA